MRTAELYIYLRNLKLPAPWRVPSAFGTEENAWWVCLICGGTGIRIYHYNGARFVAMKGVLSDPSMETLATTHRVFDTPEAALAYAEMKWGSQ